MRKNRLYYGRKIIAAAMSIFVAMESVTAATTMHVQAAEEANENLDKEETVYVITDASGKETKTIVSNWLKNNEKQDQMEDDSELTDIKNVKGDEDYTEEDGKLYWNAEGKDIYYQGETTKEAPVGIQVTYFMDGKEMTPEEITGKSGKVTIRYEYTNRTKKNAVPFLCVTGLVLPSDQFTNVQVTNGRVVSDGKMDIAVGIGMPGLKESLKLENAKELDIPESFEVTADVTDFSLDMSLTYVSSDLLNELQFGDTDLEKKYSELKDSMDTLGTSSSKLVSGTGKLLDGVSQLDANMPVLTAGTNELATGLLQYTDGAEILQKGIASAKSGAGKLVTGSAQLKTGAASAKTGVSKLESGSKTLTDGTKSLKTGSGNLQKGVFTYTAGVGSLDAGLETAKSGSSKLVTGAATLKSGVNTLAQGAGALQVGVNTLKDGLDTLCANDETLKSGSEALQAGVKTLKEGADAFHAGMQKLSELKTMIANLSTLKQGLGAEGVYAGNLEAQKQALEREIAKATENGDQETVATLTTVYGNLYGNGTEANPGMVNVVNQVNSDAAGLDSIDTSSLDALTTGWNTLYAGISSLAESVPKLTTGVAQYIGGVEQIRAGVNQTQKADGKSGLKEGMDELVYGISGQENQNSLVNGVAQLETGLGALDGGLSQAKAGSSALTKNSASLNAAAKALADGAKTLDGGAVTLKNGITTLGSGANTLAAGMTALDTGIKSLNSGLTKLDSGAKTLTGNHNKLNSGASSLKDGAQKLAKGVTDMKAGCITLNDGMVKFDQEGIQKLTKAVNGDVDELITNLKAAMKASKDYTTFSGASENQKSAVKFIYKVEEIKSEK